MKFIGVDGCRLGWFYVMLNENESWEVGVFKHIKEIDQYLSGNAIILIDIPIGLIECEHSKRLCDQEARKVLAPKRSNSVFSAPCRKAIQEIHYQEGSNINYKCTESRLSKQSWAITPKIKEVDDFLRCFDNGKIKIREIHPEVCFWALNNKRPMEYAKKKRDGFEERKLILQKYCKNTDAIIDSALSRYLRREVAKDDIADALVGAITATFYNELITIPSTPKVDVVGLPMEMVYANIVEK
jgi:predicted RNase H-like nuclease